MSTHTPIATQTLGSAAASVTFSSIPQGYTDLVMIINMQSSYTGDQGNGARLQFNGDTGSNYSDTNLRGNGSSATSYRISNNTYIQLGLLPSSGGGTPAGTLGTGIANIQNYSNSTTYKTVLGRTNSTYASAEASAGLWRNTAPITSITYFGDGNILSGSTFSIYGIAAGATGAKATGGNIVTSDGTYVYHAFTSSGTFTPTAALTADILMVAGGGGGGYYYGAGGGAGGLQQLTTQSLTTSAYTIGIGAGGASTNAYPGNGANGVNTTFTGQTDSVGGGGGGGTSSGQQAGANGGSGGGGGGPAAGAAGGTGVSGQGFAGIGGSGAGGIQGAGGGAGGVATLGQGGIGATSALINSMGAATGKGQLSGGNYYFAGGGSATGGLGGGGDSTTFNGAANTGGGCGGDGGSTKNGGSGIVIIRYAL